MSGWTKGPWILRLSDNATPHIMHEGGEDWTDVNDKTSLICAMPAEITASYNALNNARLIAAAPDLYEALEAMTQYVPLGPVECRGDKCRESWCISCCGEDEARKAVDKAFSELSAAMAALAKARGEQP